MRTTYICTILFFHLIVIANAQDEIIRAKSISKNEIESHVRFLASDELEGRKAGYKGNNVAARYIAEQFRRSGVTTVPEYDTYYQTFSLEEMTPAKTANLAFSGMNMKYRKDMLVLHGGAIEYSGDFVYAKYGLSEEDYEGIDAKGKIVVLQIGSANVQDTLGILAFVSHR